MARTNRLFRRGFTLIELLIVILIIGVLAGLIMGGLSAVKDKANRAQALSMVNALDNGLRVYREEAGSYPGYDSPSDPEDPASNVVAAVIRTLHSKQLIKLKEADLYVLDVEDKLVPATKDQIEDVDVDLYVMDPWGESYIVRENESKNQKKRWMHNKDGVDIYSKGRNLEDDTALGTEGADNDDLGNW
jgi:prepilin-type N-terminal cleavage/methylation domain-containing protein